MATIKNPNKVFVTDAVFKALSNEAQVQRVCRNADVGGVPLAGNEQDEPPSIRMDLDTVRHR